MKYFFKIAFAVLYALMIAKTATAQKQEIELASPGKMLSVKIFKLGKRLSYTLNAGNTQLLAPSSLGLIVDSVDLGIDPQIVAAPILSKINETYKTLGNHRTANNRAIEADIPMVVSGKYFNLIIRIYDDGIGIRYALPQGAKYINSECTSWNLPASTSKIAWSELDNSYEGYSHVTALKEIPENEPVMGPITANLGNYFLSISEADCENFSDMSFLRTGNIFKATFPFAHNGWLIKRQTDSKALLTGMYKNKQVTPWRSIIVAKNLTGLVNSDLIMNLCPPPAHGTDFSWVKPGRCLWQWWSIGAPQYEDQPKWYDAAAQLKWEYYLIDDGWRVWKKNGKDQWDLLKEVINYGKGVGVKTIVWVDSKEFRRAASRRAYLEKVKAAGAAGIKIDFIPNATADIMQWYMGTMQDCAELKLLLNFHGSVKPTGLRRTYPNDITREAVRGNEYQMTRYKRVAPLQQDVSLPFTRLMAGAADVTPVMLNPVELATAKLTWAHEFAQSLIILSPVTHFADQYRFYVESPLFDLFQQQPTTWDETLVLPCTDMGHVVAYARRKDKQWWIGVMNGAEERDITIPLTFLKKTTNATLVYDGSTNTSIDRHNRVLAPTDILNIKLAPGGGFVGRLSLKN